MNFRNFTCTQASEYCKRTVNNFRTGFLCIVSKRIGKLKCTTKFTYLHSSKKETQLSKVHFFGDWVYNPIKLATYSWCIFECPIEMPSKMFFQLGDPYFWPMTLIFNPNVCVFPTDPDGKIQVCTSVHLTRIVKRADRETVTHSRDRDNLSKLLHLPLECNKMIWLPLQSHNKDQPVMNPR